MLGQAVAAAATRLGHDVVALSRAELDVTDADHVRRVVAAAEPRAVVNCAAWTDVDGAETAEAAATAVNGDGAGNVARAAAESGARIVHVSTDYVFDGTKREPWLESDAVNPIGAYGRSKLAGEEQVAAATDEHAIVRTAWLFGAGGRNFVDTMLALGEERDEVSVVTDQVGSPTWTVHLAEALVELAERGGDVGDPPRGGRRRLLVVRAGRRGLRPRRRALPRPADHVRPLPAARAAPRVLGARHRARRGARAAAVAGRRGGLSEREGGGGPMRLLVCGGAGFIGSNFVRVRVRDHGDEVVVLDKLTYAGRRENLQDVEHEFVHGAIEDPRAAAEAMDERRRGRQLRRRDPRRPLDRRARRVRPHARASGTYVLLETARARGVRYLQVSTDEVYGSIEEGSFTEESPLAPSSPYSATKAGADLLVSSYHHTFGLETLICRGSNNYGPYQYPEKLIPLMVLNALHGDKLPVYGDGMNVRNWLYVEDFARGIGHVLEHGVPGEAYNVGGPDECPNIEVVKGIIELHGRRRGAHRVRHRPPRPRPPLLAGLREGPRARLGGAGALRRRPRAHRRLVPRQRVVVGADPLGRLPRVLRAPVRAGRSG